jgi:periplasmic divalent cation tolerance protein
MAGDGGPPGRPAADPGLVEVHLTTPDAATADRLARRLVEERLAACVQVVPGVRSHYRWEGEVHADDEHLLLVKTTAELFDAIRELTRSEHPYDTPELLAVPVADADYRYSSWLRKSVRRPGRAAAEATSEDAE